MDVFLIILIIVIGIPISLLIFWWVGNLVRVGIFKNEFDRGSIVQIVVTIIIGLITCLIISYISKDMGCNEDEIFWGG